MTVHRRTRAWLPLSLAVVLMVTGGVAAWLLRAEQAERNDAATTAGDEIDNLVAARHRIEIASAAFTTLTVELAQLVDPGAAWPSSARDDLAAATAALQAVVDRGALRDSSAEIAGDALDAAERALAVDTDLWALEETAYVAVTPASFGLPETADDIHLLATMLATSPSLVSIDALTLELWSTGSPGLSPEHADYVEATSSIVIEDPGWFGPEVDDPFVGGYLPGTDLVEVDAELAALLTPADGLREVWTYDQWLIARQGGTAPAPMSLPTLVEASTAAQTDMVGRVLAQYDAEIDAAQVEGPSVWWTVAWIAAIVAAVIGALVLAWTIIRHTRSLAAAALVDPLTAVANRRRLDDLRESWSASGAPDRSAVAVVDLDRFKLINDTHGHAAGDTVLRLVGRGLLAAAEELSGRSGRSEVIRLGGDEFAIVIADPDETSETRIRARIEAVGGTVEVEGASIDVGLSVGVVISDTAADLDGLLAAADLRTYERKQARRSPQSLDSGAITTV